MTLATLLVCPGCRTMSEGRIDLRTLDRQGDALVCECSRRYPIVDGVPILVTDPDAFVRAEAVAIESAPTPDLAAHPVVDLPDDTAYARLLEHLSLYLDAHWGDRATPPPDGPGAGLAVGALVERVLARERVGAAVELGCSAGRILASLAADHVVGIDLHVGMLRRTRRVLAGESLAFHRRVAGRHYARAEIPGQPTSATVICADALDPPLVHGAFDRVVAFNLLDVVPNPHQLLLVAAGLCKPGGEILLSSPYNWQTGYVGETHRFGGAAPAAALVEILTGGELGARFVVEDEAELPWTLRRDARSAVAYCIHYVRARKV